MKTIQHFIRKSIPCVVTLAAFGLLSTIASADTVNAIYNAATDVPVTASGYTATGNTVNFTLNFAPTTGTDLMVVNNTGLGFINGTFDNLTNGQPVDLNYGESIYNFAANYYGGSGNDLVLTWTNNRPFAWGFNGYGTLGDNTLTNRLSPVPVLTGSRLVAFAGGASHSLGLCSDGTVAAWGYNSHGQLGNNQGSTYGSAVPVAVNTASGVSALYGKTVVAIAAGQYHSLALRSDGTVAAWGYNSSGQLGDNTSTTRFVPVAVNTNSGVSALYGKTVVAIAAGQSHSLALCSDGTVVAWGLNSGGELGDSTTTTRLVPVAVNTASGISALYGKTVVAIAAGAFHSLALCSDGTVAAWGVNTSGQLGNNTTTANLVPVAVNTASGLSALYGKTVMAIAAGYAHSLALCSDGNLTAWGQNTYGQLGDNTTTQRIVPVTVNTDSGVSALYGKAVLGLAAGIYHNLALCSDGTVAAWGQNTYGQLGDNTTMNRSVPVAVNTTRLGAGQLFTLVASGSSASQSLALVASLPAPEISVTGNSVTIANGATTARPVDGTDFGNISVGGDAVVRSFTIQNTGLAPLNLTGSPKVAVGGPQAADFAVTLEPISPVASVAGTTTFQVTFAPSAIGTRTASLSITNDDANNTPYTFAVQGSASGTLDASYTTGNEVPATTSGFTATGSTVDFTLNYAPPAGTELMVVNNTLTDFIHGTFDNLTNGQTVALSYGGTTYNFVANYYGGNGNDLVLVWANNRPFGWGANSSGQLGDNTTSNRPLAVPVTATDVLAGKTVVSVATGGFHSLAVFSDGTMAAWGSNNYGQLGDDPTNSSPVPVTVNSAPGMSALYGKTVVATAAGFGHSLALCSDGTVAAWGLNANGQLGDNTTTNRLAPVAVNTAVGVSALYGKFVVAIAAGSFHSLALCSDGTIVTWGYNSTGQLGDNTVTQHNVAVAVNAASGVSALYGQTVVAIAGGFAHSLALCSDGTVAAWGFNGWGQIGNNSLQSQSAVPTAVNTASGLSALFGKTVVAIAAGYLHNLALCSDGTVAAWGDNGDGALGDNGVSGSVSRVPVAVNTASGVSTLFGKTVVALTAGDEFSVALCSDHTFAAWGYNGGGQLGDNTTTNRHVPVTPNPGPLAAGQHFTSITSGSYSGHTLALVAAPPGCETVLSGAQTLPNGAFQFGFTNIPGAFFSVLAATNPALPASNWTPLGDPTEVSPGQFQFTDPQATNSPQRYYRVRSP